MGSRDGQSCDAVRLTRKPVLVLQSDEGLSDSKTAPIMTAVKYTMVCLFASGLILGLCYFYVRAQRVSAAAWWTSFARAASRFRT